MVRPLDPFRALRSIALGLFALGCVLPVHAQTPDVPPPDAQAPAHISLVDGVATLERDGRIDDAPGSMPLLAGDRVRTRGGRVEILFADGSTLHLDHNSGVDLQSDELVRLLDGRIRLSIPGPAREIAYRIDGPYGWAQITEPGEYRVSLLTAGGRTELELAVIRGHAELINDAGQTPLRAGERAFVRAGAAPSYAYVANSAALDAFDRWSESRRDERMAASAEYLPDEVRPYAASLERHGYWRVEPTYGRVWYPRVAHDWRPYYHGRWVSLRPYGWTWVAHDPWGWPTHHYGRWGFSTAGWFWIPGRTWGAAWVSWAYAPGYVSWCPLGWNNRPVFQINIFNVRHGYDPWRAWTVIPRRHFGSGFVHRNVVRAGHIDVRTRGAFVLQDRAPEIRGVAVPRGSAPIRVAGTGGSRRGAAPLYTNLPTEQGRIRTDGARINVPNGSRPAPERIAPGAGARERAVPSRPAVRSDRSDSVGARPGPEARAADAPRAAVPSTRRIDTPGSVAAPDRGRAVSPRGGDNSTQPPRRSASPRGGDRTPDAPVRAETPSTSRRPAAAPQARPRGGDAPAASYEPRSRADSPRPTADPRSRAGTPRPSSEPSQRAMPRAEPARPSGGGRPPQVERRGPDRAPSGSYERRAPASAQAPAPSGGGRPSAAPQGARPRSSGGTPQGSAVRRPGGGQ
jgi:hypothetical protein